MGTLGFNAVVYAVDKIGVAFGHSLPDSAEEKESCRKATMGGESFAKGVAKGVQDIIGRPNGWLSGLFWQLPKKKDEDVPEEMKSKK